MIPTLHRFDDRETGEIRLTLLVPRSWMAAALFPRATLTWWLLRLIWRGK